MAKTTGTVRQKFSADVYVGESFKNIADDMPDIIEEAIASVADSCSIDDCNSDDEGITVEGTYETSYSAYSFAGTRDDPPEYDETRGIESLDAKEITDYIKSSLRNRIPDEDLEDINVTISESSDDAEYEEYEPDWDMMPGGHDDY